MASALFDGLAASTVCNEADSGSLSLRLARSLAECFMTVGCPPPRPANYMLSGSSHGKLLSSC